MYVRLYCTFHFLYFLKLWFFLFNVISFLLARQDTQLLFSELSLSPEALQGGCDWMCRCGWCVCDPIDWLESSWEDLSKQHREIAAAPPDSCFLFSIFIQPQGDLVRWIRLNNTHDTCFVYLYHVRFPGHWLHSSWKKSHFKLMVFYTTAKHVTDDSKPHSEVLLPCA